MVLPSRTVLFCGTPCQCDGLNRFLSSAKCGREKLFLIDFICHGTLSPLIFHDFLSYCAGKVEKRIVYHCFRNKSKGWHTYIAENVFEDGSSDISSFSSQLFTSLFYTNYSFKEACYHCQYASLNRVPDITLGDFWGIEKHLPEFDDNKGISFVIVNTKKGMQVFNSASASIEYIETPIEWTEQPHLYHPVNRPADNDDFWKYYKDHGFSKMAVRYLKAGKLRRFLSSVYQGAKRIML